jgi:hypothetical protein
MEGEQAPADPLPRRRRQLTRSVTVITLARDDVLSIEMVSLAARGRR